MRRICRRVRERLAPGPDGNRCGFRPNPRTGSRRLRRRGVDRAGDYRDYTTYFFAALSRTYALGRAVAGEPDLDGDGQVSLLWKRISARCARARAPICRVRPARCFWSVGSRGTPTGVASFGLRGDESDNAYARLAQELGAKLDLPMDDKVSRRAVKQRRAELQVAHVLCNAASAGTSQSPPGVATRNPAGGGGTSPENSGVWRSRKRLVTPMRKTRDIIRAIGEHPRYAELVQVQDSARGRRGAACHRAIPEPTRHVPTSQTVGAVGRGRFETEASAADRVTYEKLLACEQQGFMWPGCFGRGLTPSESSRVRNTVKQ